MCSSDLDSGARGDTSDLHGLEGSHRAPRIRRGRGVRRRRMGPEGRHLMRSDRTGCTSWVVEILLAITNLFTIGAGLPDLVSDAPIRLQPVTGLGLRSTRTRTSRSRSPIRETTNAGSEPITRRLASAPARPQPGTLVPSDMASRGDAWSG